MRDIPVGNGSFLVTFDDKYHIRDIYFPHVGQENHTEGFPFRFGVWTDGRFSWLFGDEWSRRLRYLPETLVTDVELENVDLGLRINCNDTVASHDNIFLRRVRVTNLVSEQREVRIFLHHDFRIYENNVGDTAYFDPETRSLIHYKKHRYFLINTQPSFDSFATGRKAFRDQEGTWRDAEDGELSRGVITEGSVDSTLAVYLDLEPESEGEFYYWIAAGNSYGQVKDLNSHVLARRPERYLNYTANYWQAWVKKNDRSDLDSLPADVADLYTRSLLITRTQIDNQGAILAANDSDVAARATDHYSYLWTRDGAFVANALDLAGYSDVARRFYEFCAKILHPNGYFLQKYNADGTVASGWHPAWNESEGTAMVPIQEDETALVLWALWQHYDHYRDIEFAHQLYRNLVIPCAEFMFDFRDPFTKLPLPSWNLWEDRHGVHTFTCSTIVAALRAAGNFARLFAQADREAKYRNAADEMVAAMKEKLYDAKLGRFVRSLRPLNGGEYEVDATVDASLFGTFYFGCFKADGEVVRSTMRAVEEKLTVPCGVARFENDGYMRTGGVTGNAWFICSLWLAEYYIAVAKTREDMVRPMQMLEQMTRQTRPSGVLPEQIDSSSGEHTSVSPLTWSHSTYVATVESYLKKLAKLS